MNVTFLRSIRLRIPIILCALASLASADPGVTTQAAFRPGQLWPDSAGARALLRWNGMIHLPAFETSGWKPKAARMFVAEEVVIRWRDTWELSDVPKP